MPYHVYLAGPIKGISYNEATDWRKEVRQMFPSEIRALSPMRYKEFLSGEKVLAEHYADRSVLATPRGITTRDRFDVMRSDVVLFNFLGAKQVSIGSVLEVAWADAFRKPIVVAMEPGNVHDHPMIRECAGYIVPTLKEAVDIVVRILLPGD